MDGRPRRHPAGRLRGTSPPLAICAVAITALCGCGSASADGVDGLTNACGGSAPLAYEPGTRCDDACPIGRWQCVGDDAVECSESKGCGAPRLVLLDSPEPFVGRRACVLLPDAPAVCIQDLDRGRRPDRIELDPTTAGARWLGATDWVDRDGVYVQTAEPADAVWLPPPPESVERSWSSGAAMVGESGAVWLSTQTRAGGPYVWASADIPAFRREGVWTASFSAWPAVLTYDGRLVPGPKQLDVAASASAGDRRYRDLDGVCAIDFDGAIWCGGDTCTSGFTTDRDGCGPLEDPSILLEGSYVALGGQCAVDADGRAICWGGVGEFARMGEWSVPRPRYTELNQPGRVERCCADDPSIEEVPLRAVVGGRFIVCALTVDDRLICTSEPGKWEQFWPYAD
ncbi:MAG: hypothetical protein H6698_03010 [Myxococcales bacterium]|nr:hypothetical protein [Myxococcales bacterium]MCB9532090.1 hypothetical protein [Myxococcales bacterium]MCB9533285.1 hypothetical protein [Myxococcales bacterium]